MVVELPGAMLACARVGAVHSVVFGGFSAESLAGRILDAASHVVVTADGVMRGGKPVQLKGITDKAGRGWEDGDGDGGMAIHMGGRGLYGGLGPYTHGGW